MRVGIITFHFVNNFGGALQAYALQSAVRNVCKVEVEIIDYKNWFIRFTDTVRLFPITTKISEFKSGMVTMGKRFQRIKKFRAFINHNTQLTRGYASGWELKMHSPGCDKYICGSDQIWNPYLTFGAASAYFLDFVERREDKIAYAPSFGTSHPGKYFQNKIGKYLSSFDTLSVRERDGAAFIKEVTGKEAVQLIDPTFLLSKEEWEEVASKPVVKGKYMLLYIMQQDEQMYEYARKIKEQKGLKLIEISRYGYKPDFVDKVLVDVGPAEFISLFKNAEYICTNSYHGFVFSLIFEKNFCLIPCKRFRSRIRNLAELLNIKLEEGDIEKTPKDTGYNTEKVKSVIAVEREKAIKYLQDNIKGM